MWEWLPQRGDNFLPFKVDPQISDERVQIEPKLSRSAVSHDRTRDRTQKFNFKLAEAS